MIFPECPNCGEEETLLLCHAHKTCCEFDKKGCRGNTLICPACEHNFKRRTLK